MSKTVARSRSALQDAIEMPMLKALADAGGKARPKEIYAKVAENLNLDTSEIEEQRAYGGNRSYKVFEQQVRWARQSAKAKGLIAGENGVWELTDAAFAKLGKIKKGFSVLLYSTDSGIALWAHAEDAARVIEDGSVKLIMTSPPYPVIKRAYGSFSIDEWLEWMGRLTGIWSKLMTADGTIAVNVRDVFVPGTPTLSPYIERFTLNALDHHGLRLAGKMFWHSPTRLPSLEWSAKRKIQPKNTIEHIILLSKSDMPAWNIDRMDRPAYAARSEAQKRSDAKRGKGVRPAGYDLNEAAFARTGAGPLPGNLIVASGASGMDAYSRRCRAEGIAAHPARFPPAVPRQIIQLTTEPGDIVYDPMAGSVTTGAVARDLGRRFIASEPMHEYLKGSAFRFENDSGFAMAV